MNGLLFMQPDWDRHAEQSFCMAGMPNFNEAHVPYRSMERYARLVACAGLLGLLDRPVQAGWATTTVDSFCIT
jgi:hypothetical protein